MKIYDGDPGPPQRVHVIENNGEKRLLGIDLRWGNIFDKHERGDELSYAILLDVLQDEKRAAELKMLFKHRLIVSLKASEHWSISEDAVRTAVESIDKIRTETAQMRRIMERERTPLDVDALGPGMEWSAPPAFKPNLPKKET